MTHGQHQREDTAVAETDHVDVLQLELFQERSRILHHRGVAQQAGHIGCAPWPTWSGATMWCSSEKTSS